MLNKLVLQNFRNYKNLSLNFNQRTLFFGKNTQGKTNILEAIYCLSTLKSFRGSDKTLIKKGEEFLSVEGEVGSPLKVVIQKIGEETKKTALKKERKVSAQKFLESFSAVLFSPEDIGLISTSPSARRRYIDIILCKTDRNYTFSLSNYKRTLLHRNNLLKNIRAKRASEKELDIWDEKIIEHGGYIIQKREDLINDINLKLSGFYQKISGSDKKVFVEYISENRGLEEKIERSRERDIRTGATNVGPQRDDIAFKNGESDIREFASRGDFRTIVLSLKLCEGEYMAEKLGADVTYLFDDVFSELDSERRSAFLDIIEGKQVIITTTDLDHVVKEFLEKAEVYEVVDGGVAKQSQNKKRKTVAKSFGDNLA